MSHRPHDDSARLLPLARRRARCRHTPSDAVAPAGGQDGAAGARRREPRDDHPPRAGHHHSSDPVSVLSGAVATISPHSGSPCEQHPQIAPVLAREDGGDFVLYQRCRSTVALSAREVEAPQGSAAYQDHSAQGSRGGRRPNETPPWMATGRGYCREVRQACDLTTWLHILTPSRVPRSGARGAIWARGAPFAAGQVPSLCPQASMA